MLVFLHGVRSGLKAKVGFICGHSAFVWRAVEGVKKKMEGITNGATHVVPEFGREGGTKWVVRDGRDVYIGEGGHKYSWGCVRSGIKDNRCRGLTSVSRPHHKRVGAQSYPFGERRGFNRQSLDFDRRLQVDKL